MRILRREGLLCRVERPSRCRSNCRGSCTSHGCLVIKRMWWPLCLPQRRRPVEHCGLRMEVLLVRLVERPPGLWTCTGCLGIIFEGLTYMALLLCPIITPRGHWRIKAKRLRRMSVLAVTHGAMPLGHQEALPGQALDARTSIPSNCWRAKAERLRRGITIAVTETIRRVRRP